MKIKSYFAPSIQEAIEKARGELGPEAMLVSSKKTGPGASRLGAYEVVFGLPREASVEAAAEPASSMAAGREGSDALARELAEMRKQIENVRRSVSRQTYSPATLPNKTPELAELYESLIGAEFSDEIAHDLVEAVAARTVSTDMVRSILPDKRSFSGELLEAMVKEEIEQRVQIAAGLEVPEAGQRIVVLVGPPGAGKTSSLVKLAFKCGLRSRTPLQIISTDTLRVGGSEQLGAYARIMGVGFRAAPNTAALEQILQEVRASKKLVLIDTPGYAPADMEEAADLRAFLRRNAEVEVHLVLPANLRNGALSSMLRRFAIFHPSKILFTHLDETEGRGGVLDAAIRADVPVSFLATGQQIPDDLEEASAALLTDKLFERAKAAASMAA